MEAFNIFKYVKPEEAEIPTDSRAITIPNGITEVRQLLTVLSKQLNFPTYFGFNWSALSDCLRDLHWINEHNVVIIHGDLPALNGPDLENYLDVLNECVRDWQPGQDHQLIVIFPETCREKIGRIMP
jgi:RNAse (barnase) inhibitor barstar